MILQIIFSYDGGQKVANFVFRPEIIKTKKSLVEFATSAWEGFNCIFPTNTGEEVYLAAQRTDIVEVPKLYKLSCCVYGQDDPAYKTLKFPTWYNRANGKVYFRNEVLEN